MRVIFYGNRQAGMVGLLTVMAIGCEIAEVWEDEGYGIPGINSFELRRVIIKKDGRLPDVTNDNGKLDLFLCVHGRKIVPNRVLDKFKKGGINLHPFLDKYPGPNPVQRAILSREPVATVYAHKMTDKTDCGQIFASASTELQGILEFDHLSVADVYNVLYPLYVEVVAKVLRTDDNA